jgi:hypothetical protein
VIQFWADRLSRFLDRHRAGNDHQRETSLPEMETPMNKSKLPKTDSIEKLAEFWGSHDLTDFEDELEEVAEPVFARGTVIKVSLDPREVEAIEQMAQAKGVSPEELVRGWVRQRVTRRRDSRPTKRSS